jgi:thiamine pyrophosphate-dependent acetolactate synthase large subunit-like protein
VLDLYGALVKINRTTRVTEYVTKPSTQIIHITMNDMLIKSWAHDYHALQAIDVPISADTSLALPALLSLCRRMMKKTDAKKKAIQSRFGKIKAHHEKLRKRWSAQADLYSDAGKIPTAFLAREIGEVLKKEDWVLANGSARGWARRLWNWSKPYQFLGDSGGAGLGYGLSAAIGAALAYRGSDKVCVDIQADGDMLMTASALYTAAHHNIPLLVVMHNNQSYYNSEEHGVNLAKFRSRPIDKAGIGTRVDNPPVDFKKVAEGFGVYAEGPIQRAEDLRPALQKALAVVKKQKKPALVDVICTPR